MDSKNQTGRRDRDRVAGKQEYEVRYTAKKLGVTEDKVRQAIQKVGNKREDVEAHLKGKGKR
jgi:hypothetical protein